MTTNIKKLILILKSRFTKPKTDKEIERKRAICSGCEFNSNNLSKPSVYKLFLILLSDFYSWITGNKKEDNLGNCNICTCSIFYSTIYESEEHCPKGKWKNFKSHI